MVNSFYFKDKSTISKSEYNIDVGESKYTAQRGPSTKTPKTVTKSVSKGKREKPRHDPSAGIIIMTKLPFHSRGREHCSRRVILVN